MKCHPCQLCNVVRVCEVFTISKILIVSDNDIMFVYPIGSDSEVLAPRPSVLDLF